VHSFPEPSGTLAIPALPGTEAQPTLHYDREVLALVVRNMRRFAGPHPDFDDLVQKAFMACHGSLATFRGQCQLSTFLYTICYRVWVRHTRWHSRFVKRFHLTDEGILPEQIDPRDPAELAIYRQRYAELYSALEKLSPPMRAVVVMHDLDELEIEEIAQIVEANVHTVRSRLRHGRLKLKAILEKQALREGQA
jgi:RNA polymerase sigma-70 factor, ECF subfamily